MYAPVQPHLIEVLHRHRLAKRLVDTCGRRLNAQLHLILFQNVVVQQLPRNAKEVAVRALCLRPRGGRRLGDNDAEVEVDLLLGCDVLDEQVWGWMGRLCVCL